MIRVDYEARLIVRSSVELDMTEEEFDNLPQDMQNRLLEDRIDWMEECRGADVDDIDVEYIEEMGE